MSAGDMQLLTFDLPATAKGLLLSSNRAISTLRIGLLLHELIISTTSQINGSLHVSDNIFLLMQINLEDPVSDGAAKSHGPVLWPCWSLLLVTL